MSQNAFKQAFGLSVAATLLGTMAVGFGLNAILRPQSALEPFGLDYPASAKELEILSPIIAVYGSRDIMLGVYLYIAAFFSDRKALGWATILTSAMPFVDGLICKYMVGQAEWNHWSYFPVILGVGIALVRG